MIVPAIDVARLERASCTLHQMACQESLARSPVTTKELNNGSRSLQLLGLSLSLSLSLDSLSHSLRSHADSLILSQSRHAAN